MTAPHTLTLYRVPTGFTYTPEGEGSKELLAMHWLNPAGALAAWRDFVLAAVAAGGAEQVLWMPHAGGIKVEQSELPPWLSGNTTLHHGWAKDCLPVSLLIDFLAPMSERAGNSCCRIEWAFRDLVIEVMDKALRFSFEPTATVHVQRIEVRETEIDGVKYKGEAKTWDFVCAKRRCLDRPWSYTAELSAKNIPIADWPSP